MPHICTRITHGIPWQATKPWSYNRVVHRTLQLSIGIPAPHTSPTCHHAAYITTNVASPWSPTSDSSICAIDLIHLYVSKWVRPKNNPYVLCMMVHQDRRRNVITKKLTKNSSANALYEKKIHINYPSKGTCAQLAILLLMPQSTVSDFMSGRSINQAFWLN